jgi:hypothetical protein
MKVMFKNVFYCLSLVFFSGCFGVSIEDLPEENKPKFLIEEYFKGKTEAWGIVLDRSGAPVKRFKVVLEGETMPDGVFQLNEFFSYDDETKEERIWNIKKLEPNLYQGTAKDVIGVARGRSKGNTLNWSYVLNLKVDDSEYEITFDDWMFLHQDSNVLINKALMYKFGIRVGEVLIFFKKP